MSLQVKKIEGEATRYFVEGASIQCTNPRCSHVVKRKPMGYDEVPWVVGMVLHLLHSWLPSSRCLAGLTMELERLFLRTRERSPYRPGDLCPKCNSGARLQIRWHVVDIAGLNGAGRCSCEYFTMSLAPKARQASRAELMSGKFRCTHIHAARDFALDVTIAAHERMRLINAKGQREEDAI